MADAKGAASELAHEVATITHEGVEVLIDRTYVRSWDGLVAAADMQRADLTPAQRYVTQIGYYRSACPNMGEVVAALAAARPGEEVTGNDAMAFVAEAVKADTPKN